MDIIAQQVYTVKRFVRAQIPSACFLQMINLDILHRQAYNESIIKEVSV